MLIEAVSLFLVSLSILGQSNVPPPAGVANEGERGCEISYSLLLGEESIHYEQPITRAIVVWDAAVPNVDFVRVPVDGEASSVTVAEGRGFVAYTGTSDLVVVGGGEIADAAFAGTDVVGRAAPYGDVLLASGLHPAFVFYVAAHELGHVLGLRHPLDGDDGVMAPNLRDRRASWVVGEVNRASAGVDVGAVEVAFCGEAP